MHFVGPRLSARIGGLAVAAAAALVASSVTASASGSPIVIDDSQLQALTTTTGGAPPLTTEKTITHFFGTSANPHDGITYGWNMAGVDPSTNSSSTIQVDITPINVEIDGRTFKGSDVLAATLASPQFAGNDYGSTPFATAGAGNLPRGPGGQLSQN